MKYNVFPKGNITFCIESQKNRVGSSISMRLGARPLVSCVWRVVVGGGGKNGQGDPAARNCCYQPFFNFVEIEWKK